jgi:hypothetical protein
VAKDRPLSFLDHHLRCGNALVGARISDLQPGGGKKPGKRKKRTDENQLSMLEDDAFRRSMGSAVGSMWQIEESPADTVKEVKEQERLYEQLRDDLTRRYARFADVVTATRFGVEVDLDFWRSLADYAAGRVAYAPARFDEWLDEARWISAKKGFFHWELEFPEVFFDRHGRPLGHEPGFDAVFGNPPYIRQEKLKPFKPYFRENFGSFKSAADLYLYFYEQGIRLLRKAGHLAYISSGTFSRADFADKFRELLPTYGADRVSHRLRREPAIQRCRNGAPYDPDVEERHTRSALSQLVDCR